MDARRLVPRRPPPRRGSGGASGAARAAVDDPGGAVKGSRGNSGSGSPLLEPGLKGEPHPDLTRRLGTGVGRGTVELGDPGSGVPSQESQDLRHRSDEARSEISREYRLLSWRIGTRIADQHERPDTRLHETLGLG